jgi:CysZ protein
MTEPRTGHRRAGAAAGAGPAVARRGLASGLGDLGRGFGFLGAHPGLWKWVLAPMLVTLLLLVGMIAAVLALARPLVAAATRPLMEAAASWLPGIVGDAASGLLWILIVAGLGMGAMLVFVVVAGIVAGPFCELLSEAIEARVTGEPGPPFSLGGFLSGAAAGLVHGLRRLAVTAVGVVLVLALGLLPVVGTAAAVVVGWWLAARASAYDCYDAVLARRGLSYRDKLAYLARHRGRTFGLGAGVAGLLLVPGINLVALGVGAAGATLAALELEGRAGPGA